MMDEARLALYEQSEANAVFRPKRGDEHELRGEGRRKIKQENRKRICTKKNIKQLCRPAVEPSSSAHASNSLTTAPPGAIQFLVG